MSIECEEGWLRDVILGKIQWRKCPVCAGRGFEYYSGETGVVYSNPFASDEKIQEELGDWCDREWCENCVGLGYVELPH